MASNTQGQIGRSHGQRVPPLIKVIINTLKNYPDGSQILKELIQNADDAGASEVEFLLDETIHSTDQLIHPSVDKYQGSALYVWNNGVFQDEDWEGIRNIGDSGKEKKVLKVGRFALGFISVYHLTDFPCILSNNDVLLLDPHMIIDNTGGLLISLEEFTKERSIASHYESFHNYFGFKGDYHYNGTIFRFPLRTGDYETKLPNNVYNPAKVMNFLFKPFKREVENCLLFMKSVNKISVSVKTNSRTDLFYSSEINSAFRAGLTTHRKEIFQFVENIHYLSSTLIYISVFPICTMEADQALHYRIWYVINILGLGGSDDLKSSYSKQSDDSYIPWFAIALPLPYNQDTLSAIDTYCWTVEYTDLQGLSDFIQTLPLISISCVDEKFIGNLFCFLPIAASSKFPFHIHGYFSLSTNRRSIKWPRHDDVSNEANWNRALVEGLGTICYAVLVHLMVSILNNEGVNWFHYNLMFYKHVGNEEDQLECVLHRGAFELLQYTKLVWNITELNWVELGSGYYFPSTVKACNIPHENVCKSLLQILSQPIIKLPIEMADVLHNYDFLFDKVEDMIINPNFIRSLLIDFNENGKLINFLKIRENVCSLIEIILSDLDFEGYEDFSVLNGIQLIPICNSEVPMLFGSNEIYYISEGPQDFLKLFPGLERSFINPTLPPNIYKSLLALSRTGQVNLEDITDLPNKPGYFTSLLENSMKKFFNFDFQIIWKPREAGQPDKSWIESIWKFIDQDQGLINILKTRELPILPKQNINNHEIELLSIRTTPMLYIQHSTIPIHSTIEELLVACGCHICHHNIFILPFHSFVQPPIPQGFFSILQQTQIQRKFIEKLSLADDSVKRAVINIILSIDFALVGPEMNITKSFPIFLSISNNWVSVNTLHLHYIPPDSLPKEFTHYPNTFLSPHDITNTQLCFKLRIERISLSQTVRLHLLPLIVKNILCNHLQQRKILSLWILRNISNFDEDLINTLSTSNWLMDSTAQTRLLAPTQLFDPNNELFAQLLPITQSGIFPNTIYSRQTASLRSLGLITTQNISYQQLQNVIVITLRNVSNVITENYNNWIDSLTELVDVLMDRFSLALEPNFWTIFKTSAFILSSPRNNSYPGSLPYYNSNNKYFNPQNVIYCSERECSLIAGVTPVFIENSRQSCTIRDVYALMGMSTKIPIKLVCEQLKLITRQSRYNSNEIHSLVKKIYKYFSTHLDINQIELPQNFVYIPDYGFFGSQRVVMSCDGNFLPYIFSLSKYYPIYEESFARFFTTFNIDADIGVAKCNLILHKLHQTTTALSVQDLNLASKVIQMIGESVDESSGYDYLMLAQNNLLYPAAECVFNDLSWLKRSELSTNKPVVHRNISNITASKLGCRPASFELAPTAESIVYSFMSAAGQSEDLVDRLKGILEGYRMHTDVFNELIQNADDAGASIVKVLFDYTSHPAKSVLHKNMENIHGPAMYLFNNARFTPRDFESILKLSSCNKLSDTEKIGRFGVGFNAVYNFTDCPSFVSNDSVQIFDPLQKYVGQFSRDSGVRIRFVNDESAVDTFRDQFQVYHNIFDCNILNREPYHYTLFRLPFRSEMSKLSSQTFNLEGITQLKSKIVNEISHLMLFLQNINCIEIYERKQNTIALRKILQVTKDDCATTHFLQNNKHYFQTYKQQLTTKCRPSPITSSDTFTVSTICQGKKTSKSYLIAYASGVGDCYDVLQKFHFSKITFLPLCGVALPLEFLENLPAHLLSKIYTFLPLPIRSPLYLNINGYFSLSQSRKHLNDAYMGEGSDAESDILTEWNLALINDALPNALITALETLPRLPPLCHNTSLISNYYSIWPIKENTTLLWKNLSEHFARRILEKFPEANLFLSANSDTWISFRHISFLIIENNVISTKGFTKFIFELSARKNILFANIPQFFYSSNIYRIFSELAPDQIFNLQRLCNQIIFPSLEQLSIEHLVLIFSTLITLCSDESNYNWLYYDLCEINFIPCGIDSSNFILRKPKEVVCPNTKLSTLYQPNELRIPVPELYHLFDFSQHTVFSNILQRMSVIYDRLPDSEIISRCRVTTDLPVESATTHAVTLIEYLAKCKDNIKSVIPQLRDIPFIPTYRDDLFYVLNITPKDFVSPRKCYTYSCHHLVTPIYPVASKSVGSFSKCLSLLNNPGFGVVLEILDYLKSNVESIRSQKAIIDDKILEIYKFLSKQSDSKNIDGIRNALNKVSWIWHPANMQFYATDQVILSSDFQSVPENTYLVSFPYMESIFRNNTLRKFLEEVGIKKSIDDETILACIERIHENESGNLPKNLVQLVLKLLDSINEHENCSDKIHILSQSNLLKRPNELFIHFLPLISEDTSEEDLSIFVHQSINTTNAIKLGVKLSEQLYSSESDISVEDFGIEEEITDRIQTLVREMPIHSLIKELIQNAEDSGATEILFILDEQDYSSHDKSLSLNSGVYPNWKLLHSCPSLTVYNNKGFSDEDIKGIQKLSVGGKSDNQNTIGKFGLGFNSVYHLTDAPSFITHRPEEPGIHLCFFDPFLKYTTNIYRFRSTKRGKKFDITADNMEKFEDQLFPFRFNGFRKEPVLAASLANIWENGDFTMFRFPLDIEKFHSTHFKYRKSETRKHKSIKDIQEMLIEQIKRSSEILLFLRNVQTIKVISIDRCKSVTLHCSQSIRVLENTSIPRPDWFPHAMDTDTIILQRKESNNEDKLTNTVNEWLIFLYPEVSIEDYVQKDETLSEHPEVLSEEKLWGFGGVAVCISSLKTTQKSNIFNFLPVGASKNFPVHINAPLFIDSSRQNVHEEQSDYANTWHTSVINYILTPLYTLLLIQLRVPPKIMESIEDKQAYFNWYYSLFPRESKTEGTFLSKLRERIYSFLYDTNLPIFLLHNLDVSEDLIWHNIHGQECGILLPISFFSKPKVAPQERQNQQSFKYPVDVSYLRPTEAADAQSRLEARKKENEIRRSLISIKLPLTFAPIALKCQFKEEIAQLDPIILLGYLNKNIHYLFPEHTISRNINSSILSFNQIQTILEYVLTADLESLKACDIPIGIDIENTLRILKLAEPSFLSTFSPLLPHHAEMFISSNYDSTIIRKLKDTGFVKELDEEYLKNHLAVDKFLDKPVCCSLFWDFVVRLNMPPEILTSNFGQHSLVPTCSHEPNVQIEFSPINQLQYIVSQTLQEKDKTLYSVLNKFICPLLNLKFIDTVKIRKINSYLDAIAISQIRSPKIIISCISHSKDITASVTSKEVDKLLQIINQVDVNSLTQDEITVLTCLKVFQTQSGEYCSLSDCDQCFINNFNLDLGTVLLQTLLQKYRLVIFSSNNSSLIQSLGRRAKIQILDVSHLLSGMIFPHLAEIPVEEQKKIIIFISHNLDGRMNLSNLIRTLAKIAFVLSDDGRKFRFNQFYSPEMTFFTKFHSHTTLPLLWRDGGIRHLIIKLGLRTEISLQDIHDVILMFSQKIFPSSDLPELFDAFRPILQANKELDLTTLHNIANIQFLPVWRIECITAANEKTYSENLVRFCDAQLRQFQNCCCTTAWIHKFDFNFPTEYYQHLRIGEYPDPATVRDHLIKITNQIIQVYSLLNIPTCYEKYFRKSYELLEMKFPAEISYEGLFNLPCILWDNKLYYPINMLISSNEILSPFVIQLPAKLAGDYLNFFKRIKVSERATYKHFALVLLEISEHLRLSDIELSESDFLQQSEKVFNSFISALRELQINQISFCLDLNQTMLLTRDSKLVSSINVVFADNLSLLSRVIKLDININILKPLEPDENKSCVPPSCLNLNNLTELVSEQIHPNVLNNNTISLGTYSSQQLQKTLKCQVVFRSMRRLYFHLTKKDLEKLLLLNGETCFNDDGLSHPGFQSISFILNSLIVVSVTQIDTIINDNRQNPPVQYPLDNSCSCYINKSNNQFLLSNHNSKSKCMQKDIAYSINTHLGGIFTDVLSYFELCFMLDPYDIMDKLDEYNISRDPWAIPPPPPPPVPIPSAPRYRPKPRGISIGKPDLPAARLWLLIAQCDIMAAKKLIRQTPPDNVNAFPSHACFFCFEAVIKIFTALLHYKGSKDRLNSERNLRFHIDHIPYLIPGQPQMYTTIEELTIPLMNYDIDTRIPSATIGCYIPQQTITLEQAIEAIQNAEEIINLITNELPVMKEMMLDQNDPIFRCLTSNQPHLITEVLNFDVGTLMCQVLLNPEDEEFKNISRCFHNSMPYSEVIFIKKIFNPTSWEAFKANFIRETNKNPDSCISIRTLFHGSSDTNPELIINDPEGFNMQYAQRGLWGCGIYFATNCSYSHTYRYDLGDGLCSVFVATVFIGYAKEMTRDRNITCPPIRPNSSERYHSVQGRLGGEVIHIVYKNCMAYPSYIITYRKN
ncbi:Sacsin-like [Oopsacas minuta]|uniref:Poly [ADP-ribose] polymerase n=1 Tax=Oopsacas minuta TaxID=111878 RepID=A0AAV7JU43_9METZ|nr:Sacsin-like [Oopsacas minuta]